MTMLEARARVRGQARWTADATACDSARVFRWIARIAGLGVLAWGSGLAWFVGVPVRAVPPTLHTDAVVVLTGDEGRIVRGLARLRAGAAPRMFISGVGGRAGPVRLAATAHVPLALFTCCVELGHTATDTRSNAEETAAWVRKRKVRAVRLVTSDYHIRRAELELAAELGPAVTILPDPVVSRASGERWMLEYHKWLWRAFVRRAEAA